LTWFDVRNAPEFSAIAPEFLQRLVPADLVIAHNAAFDARKLRGTLRHFGLECPDFEFLCTFQMSRRVWPDLPDHCLGTLAAHIGHEFHHHNAKEDAEAAGHVFLAMMGKSAAQVFQPPIRRYSGGFRRGTHDPRF
jgi:DNA polymerase III subunit epsilon